MNEFDAMDEFDQLERYTTRGREHDAYRRRVEAQEASKRTNASGVGDLDLKLMRALKIHEKVFDPRPDKEFYCGHCSSPFPCVTVKALTDPI